MTPEVQIAPGPDAVADIASGLIANWIRIGQRTGNVHVALAGGTTPAPTYRRLARSVDDWAGVDLWFGDERMVTPEHPDANVRLVREQLVAAARIPSRAIHPVPTHLSTEIAAARYGAQITEAVPADGSGRPSISIVILGIGPDGHIASLFPQSPGLWSDAVCVAVHDAPKPPPARVSLTLRMINAAQHRVVIATGPEKAPALARALGSSDPSTPAGMLRSDNTVVVLDAAAAAELSKPATRTVA